MRSIHVLFNCILILLSSVPAIAQQARKALEIGDKFPDYIFKISHGDSIRILPFSSLKGKYLILDLWSVNCTSCIVGMKKMDSLQKVFYPELQIIAATNNSAQEVAARFSKLKRPLPDIPFVLNDSLLYERLFPHYGDPLHIWIDSSGTIKYFTDGRSTTADNIRKFINNEILKVEYHSILKDFDAAQPLNVEASTRLSFYTQEYSLLMKGIYQVANTSRIEILKEVGTDKPVSIKAINSSILTLYQLAFNKEVYGFDLNMNALIKNPRVRLESLRAEQLMMPSNEEKIDAWKTENIFCYELVLPAKRSHKLYDIMRNDLNRFFGLKASIQKRRATCLVFKNPRIKRIVSDITTTNQNTSWNSKIDLTKRLIYLTQKFEKPISVELDPASSTLYSLPSFVKNLSELKQLLNGQGLELTEEERVIDVLVLK